MDLTSTKRVFLTGNSGVLVTNTCIYEFDIHKIGQIMDVKNQKMRFRYQNAFQGPENALKMDVKSQNMQFCYHFAENMYLPKASGAVEAAAAAQRLHRRRY